MKDQRPATHICPGSTLCRRWEGTPAVLEAKVQLRLLLVRELEEELLATAGVTPDLVTTDLVTTDLVTAFLTFCRDFAFAQCNFIRLRIFGTLKGATGGANSPFASMPSNFLRLMR